MSRPMVAGISPSRNPVSRLHLQPRVLVTPSTSVRAACTDNRPTFRRSFYSRVVQRHRESRSFAEMQQGSRLPVRSPSPSPPASVSSPSTPSLPRPWKIITRCIPPPPTSTRSSVGPTPRGGRSSLTAYPSRLAERKASRQARTRPWVQPTESSAKPSLRGTLRSRYCKLLPNSGKPVSHVEPAKPALKSALSKGKYSGKSKRVRFVGEEPEKPVLTPAMKPGLKSALSKGKYSGKLKQVRFIGDEPRPALKPALSKGKYRGESGKSKQVRFGGVQVETVSRYIKKFRWAKTRERVEPLEEEDEDGEKEKYITYWGNQRSSMIEFIHSEGPCGRQDCAWNSLARIQAMRPMWDTKTVFWCWNRKREIVRENGGFALAGECPGEVLVAQLHSPIDDERTFLSGGSILMGNDAPA
ncbi:hypothetical protein ASPWEDRAFT_170400 [Aspergillus wentii DTO 134E9]|uniref:Uncharacterized protein n=1 Tax=Aspergillus wentii DTO 134E9 TaxID=1073089 RepID=A0A1L9RQ04_ASPWE|nr:uncharacterized protein ASPWEDRAFT_170400 [Aspergillus wentii DTO 134E9]OJJ36898.1 hypothetical protein ASPWEDRAFT_170400 [Aspergillus wentii DTO 134E9]